MSGFGACIVIWRISYRLCWKFFVPLKHIFGLADQRPHASIFVLLCSEDTENCATQRRTFILRLCVAKMLLNCDKSNVSDRNVIEFLIRCSESEIGMAETSTHMHFITLVFTDFNLYAFTFTCSYSLSFTSIRYYALTRLHFYLLTFISISIHSPFIYMHSPSFVYILLH